MAKGKVKKLFPGGNTSQGFYSYYDHVISPDATRIFIIKGGPGTGKSSMMRAIGEKMLDMGFDVEFHCCSSDNSSLDGVCIPQLGIALIDGTAPHIVDPKNPGAVDEIINLGEFWNEGEMRKNKKAILATNRRVGRLFGLAYFSLKEAKAIQDEWESYISESMNWSQVNEVTALISEELFSEAVPNYVLPAKSRHLFASAITPEGSVNYHDTVLQDVERLFVIKGEPGSGKATLLASIAKQAAMLGLDTEIYHCSFVPQNIDVIVIPKLLSAVANLSAPVSFDPNCLTNLQSCKEINLSAFSNPGTLNQYADEILNCLSRFDAAFNRAVRFIHAAKAEHDVMESYYIAAMDFAAINAKKEVILARILKYTEYVTE